MSRTRIKICGLTRPEDVQAAVAAGADALGFVYYPKSPRYVTAEQSAALMRLVPPYVSTVALFVNASVEEVSVVARVAPFTQLQFHGDETPEQCAALAAAVCKPFAKAFRVKPEHGPGDLLEYEAQCRRASPLFSGLLLDTWVDAYGGAGKVFDWSIIPKELAPRVVLSGGLSVSTATSAVVRVRPFAVDISSGVEAAKGIKDASLIRAFIGAVRDADTIIESETPS